MLAWIFYILVVSLVLSIAAFMVECAARLRRTPTRWPWVFSIILSLLLPVIVSSVSVPSSQNISGDSVQTAPQKAIALRQLTSPELSPATWLNESVGPTVAAPDVDILLQHAWVVVSGTMLLVVLSGILQLYIGKRRWAPGIICGVPVYIAEDSGPAIVGLLRPRIVVPRWLTLCPAEDQELVISHEKSHLEAYDAQLLMIALVLLTCMPWNLPMWWQFRRLRNAIEIDCDARVLTRGHDVSRYGRILIAVGEKQSKKITVAAAMSEPKSFLEHRIRHMLQRPQKILSLPIIVSALFAIGLTSVAAQIRPPNADEMVGNSNKEISLDSNTLDRYVGFYHDVGDVVVTIVRNGSQLSLKFAGLESLPIYPSSKSNFFYKAVGDQLTFVTNAQGRVIAVIFHQNGQNATFPRIDPTTAKQFANNLAEKIRDQTPDPRSGAILLRVINSLIRDRPDYADVRPDLVPIAQEAIKQNSKLTRDLTDLSEINSIKFSYVNWQGADVYEFTQGKATWYWNIILDPNGKIILLHPWIRRKR